MKLYKRCCIFIIATLAALVLYNALVWHLCTRKLLSRDGGWYTGDLARMGYLSAYTDLRRNEDDLPRRHREMARWDGQPVDVVTVGDSFSQGGGNGPNRYYQDHLASSSGVEVLNVPPYPGASPLQTAVLLMNSGLLDRLRPRHLLLEVVERNCVKGGTSIDWERSETLEGLTRFYATGHAGVEVGDDEAQDLPSVGFINSGNVKWLVYNLLYNFSDNAFFAKTHKGKLKLPLFSGEKGDTLLFLRKDGEKAKQSTPGAVVRVNDNLNRLAALLKAKGIILCFMPVPDKYTLYHPHLRRASHAPSRLFPLLRTLPREYRFIDTEAILASHLARGEKDLYYLDDTHWSWRASRVIFAVESFR